jgi:hypothetical protein
MSPKFTQTVDPIERFLSKIRFTETCWIWEGSVHTGGYGQFWFDGRYVSSHIFAYILWNGPIPAGFQIDHVKARGCTSKLCCCPDHLEAVTSQVNVLRADSLPARNIKKTHCPQGHAYDEANTYWHMNQRYCRICVRNQKKRRQLKASVPEPA